MKKIIISLIVFNIFQLAFTQKKELKTVDKLIKTANYESALITLESIKDLIEESDNKIKAKYFYLRGLASYENGASSFENKLTSIKDFNEVIKIEDTSTKIYTSKVNIIISELFNSFVLDGQKFLELKNYKQSSQNFEAAYRISSKDTLYLRNAALVSLEGKNLDRALEYYFELIELGFTGISMTYLATEKESNIEQTFQDKQSRDFSVDVIGTHTDPRDVLSESVEVDILRTVGAIFREKKDYNQALKYLSKAKEINPDDVNVLLLESNISYEMGNVEKYEKIVNLILELNPNDETLYYNLGVVNMERGNYDKALEYYKKAISLDPKNVNSYTNSGVTIMRKRQPIIDEMDGLGMSNADYIRYDELKEEINILQLDAVEFFIKAYELNFSIDLADQIRQIYAAVGDETNEKKWAAIIIELENK